MGYICSADLKEFIEAQEDSFESANPQLLMDKWVKASSEEEHYPFKGEARREGLVTLIKAVENAQSAVKNAQGFGDAERKRISAHWPHPVADADPPRSKVLGLSGSAKGGAEASVSASATEENTIETLHLTRKTTHLALHLSRPTPLENAAVCLHALWAVRYIPGSGLKGAARNAALYRLADTYGDAAVGPGSKGGVAQVRWRLDRLSQEDREAAKDDILVYALTYGLAPTDGEAKGAEHEADLLGATRTAGLGLETLSSKKDAVDEWAGQVVFWNAYPSGPAKLMMDILTPHHPTWYQEQRTYPSDTDAPQPLPFVVISGNFTFALSLRETAGALLLKKLGIDRHRVLAQAMDDLRSALEDWGIGAKTSAGYGLFTKPDPSEKPEPPPEPMRPLTDHEKTVLRRIGETIVAVDRASAGIDNPNQLSKAQEPLTDLIKELAQSKATPDLVRRVLASVDNWSAVASRKRSRGLRKALQDLE